jgi:transcriptional regulator with XRE-family HTH domain
MEKDKNLMVFKEWLFQKFIEWQGGYKKRMTYGDFAEYLGVSRISLSDWMNGKYLPSHRNISFLSEKLGPDIFNVLGIKVSSGLETFPESLQGAIEESRQEIQKQNLTVNSPESMKLIIESFSRHGYELKEKTK